MKKTVLLKIFLILLPGLAVLLATTEDSVTVFDSVAQTTEYYSYFDLVPVTVVQLCTPLAALLAVAATILAVLFVVLGKMWCIKGMFWTAFLSAVVSSLPLLMRTEVIVVPTVFFTILMGVACLFAYSVQKKPGKLVKEKTGARLEKH